MCKKMFLMRHGETLFNTQHRIQGWCDSPLTENGKKQAIKAKKYFEREDIIFDHAYCSTSERTEDTLKIVCDMPYQRLKELKEMNYGFLEGQPELKLTPKQCETYYLDFGGESSNTVKNRMYHILTEIMQKNTHQCVLIVGHGAACFNFLRAIQDPTEELKKGFGNGTIFEYDFDDGIFSLKKVIRQDDMED